MNITFKIYNLVIFNLILNSVFNFLIIPWNVEKLAWFYKIKIYFKPLAITFF